MMDGELGKYFPRYFLEDLRRTSVSIDYPRLR
jgi:hypothetical protein